MSLSGWKKRIYLVTGFYNTVHITLYWYGNSFYY